jgi:Spy/CpxP family protein refolding chaperone
MFWQKWAFAHPGPCGPFHHHRHRHHTSENRSHEWGRGFGVRRPLRFLARELELDPEQTEALAEILEDLKIQRAQAKVDHKKAIGAIAGALAGDTFDAVAVEAATQARAHSAAEVERAVAKALERTHALLDAEQRKRLAYLLRTDGITI